MSTPSSPPDARPPKSVAPADDAPRERGLDRGVRIAREAGEWLLDEAKHAARKYRARSRYYKWRSWIIALYALIATTSIVAAIPPLNTINAYVVPSRDFRNRVIVAVENQGTERWTKLRLILDDTWVFERDELAPGDKVMPNVSQFVRQKGTPANAPESLQPRVLRVVTAQGSYSVELFDR